MGLLSKLTSLEPLFRRTAVLGVKGKARLLVSVLFCLLVCTSCSANGLWTLSSSKQRSDVNRLSAASGGNDSTIPGNRSQSRSLGEPTTIAQQSDINGKTSPDIAQNGVVSKASTFNLSSYPVVNSHSSEILGFFTITDPVKGIVTIEKSGGVFLWALPALRSYRLFQLSEAPESVAFSPERRLFAVAKGDLVTLRRFEDGEEVSALHRLKTRASSMVFQPNGRTLLIGGTDGELYRWRFEDEKLTNLPKEQERMLERYFGHAKVISAVAYHPIGRVFFSGDWGGALSAWLPYDADAFKGKYDENNFGSRTYTDRSTRVHGDRAAATSIEHLALSPDGEQLLVGSQDGALEWWRVRGFSMLATISAHKGLIYDLAIAPSGKRAASVGRDGMLRVWALTETAVPETAKSEFTLDKLKEMPLAGAARILFLNENTAIVGDKSGSVSVVTL